jgi:hypothetical protein
MRTRISRKKLAERRGQSVKTIQRKQKIDPLFPKSVVDASGRHFFYVDEVERYEAIEDARRYYGDPAQQPAA